MVNKRKPLLVDRLLAAHAQGKQGSEAAYLTRGLLPRIINGLVQAKRFVFDEQSTRYMGEMIKTIPKAIVHAQEFAIQPFPTMYVEFPAQAMFEATTDTLGFDDGATRMGFLYDQGRVYTLLDWEKLRDQRVIPYIVPVSYGLNRQWKLEDERQICEDVGINRLSIDALFWGSAYALVDDEEKRAFRANHSMRMEIQTGPLVSRETYIEISTKVLSNIAGDLRNVIAILLFLNRTSKTRIEDFVPMRQTMIGTKPSAMLSHSVVHFNLNPLPKLYESFGTGSAWRREHDVRGHFCHDKTTRESFCRHDWTEYDVNQWRCLKCSGLKWWRKEHRRGHRDKGVMQTTYEVHQ
jgi:hypothetical protein